MEIVATMITKACEEHEHGNIFLLHVDQLLSVMVLALIPFPMLCIIVKSIQ